MKKTDSYKQIRFGLMCESPILKAWEAECINKTLNIGNIDLALLIFPSKKSSQEKANFFENKVKTRSFKRILFRLFEKALFRPKCYSQVDLTKKFKDIPSMICTTEERNSSDFVSAEYIAKIKSYELDFILLLSGFGKIKGEILNSARYGVWLYNHGDIEKYKGGPPCFWEIYNNDNVNGAVLQKLTLEHDIALILRKGYFKTIKNSYKENLNNVLFESTSFVREACNELINFIENPINYSSVTSCAQKYSVPSNLQFIIFFLKLLRNKASKIFINLFFIEQWNIGYIESPIEALIETDKELKINWFLSPKKNEFFADPSVIKTDKGYYILFENFSHREKKANIATTLLNLEHKNDNINISLNRPHHLSYPFVFQHNDDIYMTPGEWETNGLILYKAKYFPSVWEKSAVLIENIPVVDPTLFKHNSQWWLFFTQRRQGPDIRLFIYYSDNLFGPWQPHKKNPVKTDISSARPAGSIFRFGENLIRPAQDSSKTYGGRIILYIIKKLTPEEFEEEPLKYLEPRKKESFNKGIHTINSFEDLTVIDGKRYIFSLNSIKKTFRKKLYKKSLIQNTTFNYAYLGIPRYVEKKEYTKSIDRTIESLKIQNGIRSIYQVGSINHPGISDIDIIAVFEDEVQNNYNLRSNLRGIDKYLFTHNISGICESYFKLTKNFMLLHYLNLLWGKELIIGTEILDSSEINAVKIQIALEYLVSYFIDLTTQLKYRVIKLRTLLQHIKAIKYDLDYLDVPSGLIYEMVYEFLDWIDYWFDKPKDIITISKWIDKFYKEFKKFLDISLNDKSFYIPDWANLRLSRNLRLEFGEFVDCKFTGFLLPKSISRVHRKIFNINSRFNLFNFAIPFSTIPTHKILEERYIMAKEMKEYNMKYLPYYTPVISGFAFKIM